MKKYKPACKVGDLVIWRNDKGLITEIRHIPEGKGFFGGNTYYIIDWLEEQEDGGYLNHQESTQVEQFDDAVKNRIYDLYPAKQ